MKIWEVYRDSKLDGGELVDKLSQMQSDGELVTTIPCSIIGRPYLHNGAATITDMYVEIAAKYREVYDEMFEFLDHLIDEEFANVLTNEFIHCDAFLRYLLERIDRGMSKERLVSILASQRLYKVNIPCILLLRGWMMGIIDNTDMCDIFSYSDEDDKYPIFSSKKRKRAVVGFVGGLVRDKRVSVETIDSLRGIITGMDFYRTILFCSALISRDVVNEAVRILLRDVRVEVLFGYVHVSGYTSDIHRLAESAVIAIADKPLKDYNIINLSAGKRLKHLLIEDV